MGVWERLRKLMAKRPALFVLIDPDETGYEKAREVARQAYLGGADAILIGGTVGVQGDPLDKVVIEAKKEVKIPVILFPSDISGISPYADAILFLSLLNSRNPYYITGAQALAAPIIKRIGIEPIPTAYLITEPGGETAAGWVGDARPLPVRKPQLTAAYAMAAELMGFKLIYLEAGSGARFSVHERLIRAARKAVSLPIIVGGGIKSPREAEEKIHAGANGIVIGTAIENSHDVYETCKAFKTVLIKSSSS